MITTKAGIANTAVASTIGGGGMLWWLGEHAAGLGALAAIFGALVAFIFYLLNYIENKRHNRAIEAKTTNPES